MKKITIQNGVEELGVFEKNNEAWVTSNFLAEKFEKDHKNILQGIENVLPDLGAQYSATNFKKSTYMNRGKKYPCYLLNRKAYTLVAMGFTGKKALAFKVQYIEAFENMFNLISTRIMSKDGYKEMCQSIKEVLSDDIHAYSREANLVNKIVLGMSAKKFKECNDITNTRDVVIQEKLEELDRAQKFNSNLIRLHTPYGQRKRMLDELYGDREEIDFTVSSLLKEY